MPKPTIVITGANGFVGSTLVTHFASKGWTVRGLVRNPAKLTAPAKNVTYHQYELGTPFDDAVCKGADYIVHTAYVKYDRQHPDALQANTTGAEQLRVVARKHHTKLVFLSSMSAHEQAVSVYGKQKLAIEQLFDGPGDAVLRCGLIIGNGGIVQEMVGFLRTKRMVPLVDGGKQPLQIIGIADLAAVIQNICTKDLSGRFTVANPHVYEYKALYETIGKTLGVKLLFVPVPFIVLLTAIRALTLLRLPLPVGEDNLWGLKMLRAADNADDMRRIGVQAADLPEAMRRAKVVA
ncbi:MAG TPA: NAD-dependent epimerase/dehydratase family protein [Candidatus Saccharimonadales bacterium]|nr:NAD-dependent epimerase/dehydratase family protein [Candidatus Saccharimonadales bacterium]